MSGDTPARPETQAIRHALTALDETGDTGLATAVLATAFMVAVRMGGGKRFDRHTAGMIAEVEPVADAIFAHMLAEGWITRAEPLQ